MHGGSEEGLEWSQWSNPLCVRVCPSISKIPFLAILGHISRIFAFLLLAIFTRISARKSEKLTCDLFHKSNGFACDAFHNMACDSFHNAGNP